MSQKSIVSVGTERALSRRDAGPLTYLQHEIDRLFDGVSRGLSGFAAATGVVPRIDVGETDKMIEITAELPGLETKDLSLNLVDDVLIIRGEKRNEREEKGKDYQIVERSYGSFSRSVELPAGVKPEDVSAEIAKGILKVSIMKPAPRLSRKIDVKDAA